MRSKRSPSCLAWTVASNFSPYRDRGLARLATGGRYEVGSTIDVAAAAGSVSRPTALCRRSLARDPRRRGQSRGQLRPAKGAGIASIVKLPDGRPLAGAEVVLVSPLQPAFLTNGLSPESEDHRIARTGADGHFTFPPLEPPYTIVVLHLDRGFAEQTIGNASARLPAELTLRPWGRVEGTLRIGRRPGAGERLTLSYDRTGDTPATIPWWSGEATTDDAGRFAFARVMPGEVTSRAPDPPQENALEPDVGPNPDHAGRGSAWHYRPRRRRRHWPTGHRQVDGPRRAGRTNRLDLQQRQPDSQGVADPGCAYPQRAQEDPPPRSDGHTVKLEADGSFRVEMWKRARMTSSSRSANHRAIPFKVGLGRELLATARLEVDVFPMPGGRSDEPLDLGAIPVTVMKKPKVAPAAPTLIAQPPGQTRP